MKDSDLDRLLSDLEGEVEYTGARKEIILQSQRIARRSDTTVEEIREGLDPEAAFRDSILDLLQGRDLGPFRGGVSDALKRHNIQVQQLKKFLSDTDGTASVVEVLKKYHYTFIKSIENIEMLYDEYAGSLSQEAVQRRAKKEYNVLFEGFEQKNELDFLCLKELFLKLREFNSRIRKEWDDLYRNIGVIKLVPDGKDIYREMVTNVNEALGLCRSTDQFLYVLSRVLGIPEKDYDVIERDIFNKIVYHPAFPYQYDSLFILPEKYMGQELPGDVPDALPGSVGNPGVSGAEGGNRQGISDASQGEARSGPGDDAPLRQAFRFTVKGTRNWNVREPYIIKIDFSKLAADLDELKSSFYFIDRMDSESVLDGELKRAMMRYLNDRSKDITEYFGEFILKMVFLQVQELGNFFGLEGEKLHLLVYHLGPSSLNRILINYLQAKKLGFCFKYLQGSRVVRYVPLEFIKAKVLGWFEENINICTLPFDGIHEFDETRKTVSRKYYAEVDSYNKKLDQLIRQLKLDSNEKFNRGDFFRSKWNDWFGSANIVVYNRFMEKTIFK